MIRQLSKASAGFGAVLFGLIVVSTSAAADTDACGQQIERFSAFVQERSLGGAIATGEPIVASNVCPAETRNDVARRLALLHLAESTKLSETPATNAEKLRLLLAGARYAKPWQLMAALGDLRRVVMTADGEADHQAASQAYQDALLDINDRRAVPSPPASDVISRLVRLAQQSRLLTKDFVSAPGTLTRDVRGVTVEAVPVPIQFARDSSEMTTQGQAYAEELWKALVAQGSPAIELIGHTDPDGAAGHNDALSVRRAGAVRNYMVRRGYKPAIIELSGKGSRDPLRIIDERQYTQAQLYKMYRRVEVRFR